MKMSKKIDRIMKDLETLDASAQGDRDRIKKSIEKLIRSKPDTGYRSSFKKRLGNVLLSRAKELSRESSEKPAGKLYYLKKYRVAGSIAAAVIAAFVFIPLYFMQTGENEKQIATTYKQEEMPSERLGKPERIREKKLQPLKKAGKSIGQGLTARKEKRRDREKTIPPPAGEIAGMLKMETAEKDDKEGISTRSGNSINDISGVTISRAPMKEIKKSEELEESKPLSGKKDEKKRKAGRTAIGTVELQKIYENVFLNAGKTPLSTFTIVTGTASYPAAREFLNSNRLPPRNSVRVEEFINYFSYDYPSPRGDLPFSITAEAGKCPWNMDHTLVHIGVKGRRTITGNVSIEAEFNPALVRSYRLIGSGNSVPGRGESVTALYEVIPASVKPGQRKTGLIAVKVRYRKPGENKSRLIAKSVRDTDGRRLSRNFMFSAAVAEFGMLLRKSRYRGNASYVRVRKRAERSLGKDRFGYRREFMRLVNVAEQLDKGK
jgi:hypothetical protein